jgi:CheY-like chemotaxis protein
MVDILILEDETALLDALVDGLHQALPEYSVRGASRVEEAREWMALEIPRLVISDIMLPGESGIEFLLATRSRQPSVKFVLMSAFPSITPDEALAHGAIRLLRKPFPIKDLLQIVQEALGKESFDGSVEGLTLMDLMQLLHWAKRSSIISVDGPDIKGKIHFYNGEVVHAQTGREMGVAAFDAFVRLHRGTFKIKPASKKPEIVTIDGSFQQLALDALRLLDERGRHEPGQTEGQSAGSGTTSVSDPAVSGETDHQQVPQSLMTNDIGAICRTVLENGEEVQACGVIDLSTGLLLGVFHKVHYFTTSFFEAVATTALAIFRGKEVRQIESLLSRFRQEEMKDAVEEVFLNTGEVLHFMKVIPSKNAVLFLLTRKTANMAMGWVSLRAAVPDVERVLT